LCFVLLLFGFFLYFQRTTDAQNDEQQTKKKKQTKRKREEERGRGLLSFCYSVVLCDKLSTLNRVQTSSQRNASEQEKNIQKNHAHAHASKKKKKPSPHCTHKASHTYAAAASPVRGSGGVSSLAPPLPESSHIWSRSSPPLW
jgi:ABC-type nickel/cobalt efflux system permease component RcnA